MGVSRSAMHWSTAGVAAFGFFAGCAPDESDAGKGIKNDVRGTVSEWAVDVDADGAMAGEVVFTVTNAGSIDHEFLVLKTEIPVGEIPLVDDKFDEAAEGIQLIREIPAFAKGTTEVLTLTLDPGNYQLVCNIAGHYGAGMHTAFVVE